MMYEVEYERADIEGGFYRVMVDAQGDCRAPTGGANMTRFDQWLADDEGVTFAPVEAVAYCPHCGLDAYDHIPTREFDDDGNDYETLVCP